jgi:hypothetical protein
MCIKEVVQHGVMLFAAGSDGNTSTTNAREWHEFTTPQAVQHPSQPLPFILPARVASVRLYYTLSPDGEDAGIAACEMHRAFYEQMHLGLRM